jgi:hypothetical protein
MNTEIDNRMVWDQRRAGRYEVWYSTFNHLRTGTGFWIRYTIDAPTPGHGSPTCQLWFAFFDVEHPERNLALNRKIPLGELEVAYEPFSVRMGTAVLKGGELKGQLEGDTHTVSWDLAFAPSSFTHRHLPDFVYRAEWADTKVLSPNLMIHLNGRVKVDDRTFEFDGDPGCQTHLYGRKHAHSWAWSHCNAYREDPTACLETLTVRLKKLGLVTPPLTFFSLYLGGEVYHFRELTMTPFTRGRWETGQYRIFGVGRRVRIAAVLKCRPEDLVLAQYSDPDGEPCFCHNTEVASAAVTVWTRRSLTAPFKKLCRLTAEAAAHFEYAGRLPDGHVPHRHVTVR